MSNLDKVNTGVVIAGAVNNYANRVGVKPKGRLSFDETRAAIEAAIVWHKEEGLTPEEAARSAVRDAEYYKKHNDSTVQVS